VRGSGRTQPDTTPDARSGFPPGSILASTRSPAPASAPPAAPATAPPTAP